MNSWIPRDPGPPARLGLALLASALLPGIAQAGSLAFSRPNPLFTTQAVDAVEVDGPGGFQSIPLPTAPEPLEFPWDVDFANGRLFVVGTGQDDGTAAPLRDLNDVDRGTIHSVLPDGSDPQLHASGLDRPLHLDVTSDGSTIYFAEQGANVGTEFQSDGRVGRIDVASGAIETVVNAPATAGPTEVSQAFEPVRKHLHSAGRLAYHQKKLSLEICDR